MRTAVVTTSYPERRGDPSGHFVEAEVRALRASGESVSVFVPRGPAFGWPGISARLRESPWSAWGAARELASLSEALQRASPFDRVIAHWALPSAWPVARSTSARLTVVSHGGDVRLLASLPWPVRNSITVHIARRAEVWRFVSESLCDELLGTLAPRAASLVRSRAQIAPSPFELPDVSARARELRSATPRPLYVAAARLVASKRISRAIDYAAASRACLVILGDGPERAPLEAYAEGRSADVRFYGTVPRDEALAWIAAADALLHASVAEGASTVVREANALGTRVVEL